MEIYCLKEFKDNFEKLLSKKTYQTLEKDIINYFFNKEFSQLLSGTRLNNSSDTPYIKKRLKGSGGYRFYFLLIIKEENLYLMFVHPKTGPNGSSNIADEYKALLYKKVLEAIQNKDFFELKLDSTHMRILFEKLEPIKA